jgi:hypothetical protein
LKQGGIKRANPAGEPSSKPPRKKPRWLKIKQKKKLLWYEHISCLLAEINTTIQTALTGLPNRFAYGDHEPQSEQAQRKMYNNSLLPLPGPLLKSEWRRQIQPPLKMKS